MQHATRSVLASFHGNDVRCVLTVLRVVHLVNEESHVIIAVNVAPFAVFMRGLFDLMLDHKLM